MKRINTKLWTALITVGLFFAFAGGAFAQNFVRNAGSDYNATCNAVIKIKNVNGQFTGAGNLGTSEAEQIPGVVDWAAAADDQNVQALHYNALYLSGGDKVVADGIFVYGAACPTAFPAYTALNTYPFYYDIGSLDANFQTGTFTYGGTNQNIFPAYNAGGGQPDNYYTLALTGGNKNILASDNVGANSVTSAATSPLGVAGSLYLGAGTSTLAGNLDVTGDVTGGAGDVNFNGTNTINGATAFVENGTGDMTFGGNLTITEGSLIANAGAGTVNLDGTTSLVGSNSVLNFGAGTSLVITGPITNSGDGTNLDFACTSTVTYDAAIAQNIMPTLSSNAYGSLVLTNSQKTGANSSYGANIFVCDDFSLTGGNLAMNTNGGTLTMQAVDGTVTYGGGTGNEEVVGEMARTMDANPGSFTFNNRYTTIDLLADADNPTLATMNILPGGGSNMPQWVGATDVNRNVTLSHNAGADFEMNLGVGYQYSEGPGGWAGNNTQASIRMWEGNVTQIEKMGGTGSPFARTAAPNPGLGQVKLDGIGRSNTTVLPNNLDLFASGNDVILRTGPTVFITVNDGRWTNPNTWDENATPTGTDDTWLRHMVYVGIDGPFAGTLGANNTTDENTVYPGNAAAARTITIQDVNHASLVIGNEDNPASYVFHTSLNTANSFINANTNTGTAAFPYAIAKGSAARENFNGLWLIGKSDFNAVGSIPTFGTYQIDNTGVINNEGIIEVGE